MALTTPRYNFHPTSTREAYDQAFRAARATLAGRDCKVADALFAHMRDKYPAVVSSAWYSRMERHQGFVPVKLRNVVKWIPIKSLS
jgi:VanZ family protein